MTNPFPTTETSTTARSDANAARRRRSRSSAILVAAVSALVLGITGGQRDAQAVGVTITMPGTLVGAAGRLEFDLFDGDFVLGNSTVTISNIATDGTLLPIDPFIGCVLGCNGGPPYVLDDAAGFGLFLQDLTLGSVVSFDLAYTANFVSDGANSPDRLIISLLDPGTNFTLVDTDLDALFDPIPYQDALLVLDLVDGTQPLVPTTTNPPVTVSVPEPGTLALLALGLVFAPWRGMREAARPAAA